MLGKEPQPQAERGLFHSPLYPILDGSFDAAWPPHRAIRALGAAGCRVVQLRGKELSARAFFEWARSAVEAARDVGVSVVINDRVDLALVLGAAGAHVGQEDLSVPAVRKILGDRPILGLSTHDLDQAREAESSPVDYVAIGPVFETRTKESVHPSLGPEGVTRVRAVVKKPLVAIGGITLENGSRVIDAGADSLAVISGLMLADDLETAARAMIARWGRAGRVETHARS